MAGLLGFVIWDWRGDFLERGDGFRSKNQSKSAS
jgi:hypothetical protein